MLALRFSGIWALIISIAAMGVVHVSYLIQSRFRHSPLATVVESTIYPVYEIPFPAITVCNYNRLDWNRVDDVIGLYDTKRSSIFPFVLDSIYFLFQLFATRE